MHLRSARVRVVPVAIVAAATALLFGSLVPGGEADARRRPPPPDPCAEQHNPHELRRLQAEVAQLQSDLAAYQGAYQALSDGIDRLERLVTRRVADQRVQNTLVGAINRTRAAGGRYFAAAAPVAPVVAPAPVPPPPPPAAEPYPVYDNTPQAMAPREFRRLRQSVAAARFADDRVALVRTAAEHNLFTVAQVVELMKALDFEQSRLDIAEFLYPRVVDVDAWYQVYAALEFDTSRDQLRRRTEGRKRHR